MESFGVLLLVLVVGLAVGAAGAWLVLRSRREAAVAIEAGVAERAKADAAQAKADVAQAKVEAEQAKTDAANARTEAAGTRAELARLSTETERARGDVERGQREVAEARAETAHAQAEAAGLEATVRALVAERDAAIQRAAELGADREGLLTQFKVLSGEVLDAHGKTADANADKRLQATEALLAPVRETLQRFEARLGDVEKERAAMQADLRAQVQYVQATGEHLRRETSALTTALRKPHVRGAWGELQLKRVVELAGMVDHCDFCEQASSTTDERNIRPDLQVFLPGGKFVYVDAKVPLTAFLDAQNAVEEAERTRFLGLFAKNVRGHIEGLSTKQYWKADPATPEFVVLFLPSEALAAEAFGLAPDLLEYAAARNIILATPSTLIALLRSVAHGWNQAALAESAREVSNLGRELYDRLTRMGSHVDKVGRGLASAVRAYNETVASLETRVFVTARKFRDLKVTNEELKEPSLVEGIVRPLVTPELVEDAAGTPAMIGRERRRPLAVTGQDTLDAATGDDEGPATEAEMLARPVPDPAELAELATEDRSGPREATL